MKDEIKEIERILATSGKYITYAERCYVLDCITNLQEKLKEYKMLFDAFSKRPYAHRYLEEKKKELGNSKIIGLDSEMIYKDYYDLKEKNERLKEIEKEHKNCTRKHWQQKCAEHCANEIIYKQRIDKAIEILKDTNVDMPETLLIETIDYARHILNGDDK